MSTLRTHCPLTSRDIAELRLFMLRSPDDTTGDIRDQVDEWDFFQTIRPVLGELLARADAFEKICRLLEVHPAPDVNQPSQIAGLLGQIARFVEEFKGLVATAQACRKER